MFVTADRQCSCDKGGCEKFNMWNISTVHYLQSGETQY